MYGSDRGYCCGRYGIPPNSNLLHDLTLLRERAAVRHKKDYPLDIHYILWRKHHKPNRVFSSFLSAIGEKIAGLGQAVGQQISIGWPGSIHDHTHRAHPQSPVIRIHRT